VPRRAPLVVAGAVLVGGVALGGFLVARENAVGTPAAETSPTAAVVTDGADDGVAGSDGDGAPRTVVSPPPSDPADVATDTATPSSLRVDVTYAVADHATGGIAVGSLVAGVVEDGGSCLLTLEQDGRSATATGDGHADVSTTTCGQLFVPYSQLGSGTWSARVSYTSVAGATSTSGAVPVDVP